MLTALAALAIFGALGWVAAWYARGQAIEADQDAIAAAERSRIAELKASGIRLNETALRNTVAMLQDELAVERVQRSTMQLELATLRADQRAMRSAESKASANGEDLYDSTTKRLRNPAALATPRLP